MSKKSLQEVWVKIATQRQAEAQRQILSEKAIQEDRERARQAYLLKNKMMYELAFNPSATAPAAAASSAAGAGGGGGGRLRTQPVQVTSDQSVLFYDQSNYITYYFIYNFVEEKLTSIKQLSGNSYQVSPVTNGGFCIVTQTEEIDESFDRFFHFIDLNGDVIWQDSNLSSEYWEVETFSRYSVPYYEKDGKYKLAILDLQGVRQISFDHPIEGGGYSYDDVHNGGFVILEEVNSNLYRYYFIPDGSTTPIPFKEYDPQIDTVNVYQYAFSDKIVLITNYSSFEIYTYNESGYSIISDFSASEFSNNFLFYDFSFLDSNGSFVINGQDNQNNNMIVLFYSGQSNSFSYKSVDDGSFNNEYEIYDQRDYKNVSSWHAEGSAIFIYYNNSQFSRQLNYFNYRGEVKMLPIWSTDNELRDFYTFSSDKGLNSNLSIQRNGDYINCLLDNDAQGIYYFSDAGDPNEIDNGGDSLFNNGNRIYIDDIQISYSHTQLPDHKNGGMRITDYPKDGEVTFTGVSPSTSYFTNLYPGLFVFASKEFYGNKFSIDGNVGLYDGTVDDYSFEYVSGSTNYKVFVKTNGAPIYDFSFRPSVNHITIIKGITYSNTTHGVGSGSSDSDILDNLIGDEVTELYYLLTSQLFSVQITQQEVENMVSQFLDLVEASANINQLLSSLNTNYTNITDVLKQRDLNYSVLRFNKSGGQDILSVTFSKSQNFSEEDEIRNRTILQIREEIYIPNATWGWNDLSDVDSRTYSTFKFANNKQVGNYVTEQQFVMRDIVNDQYWAIQFTEWSSGGGDFAYTRQLIESGTFSGPIISYTHSGTQSDVIFPGVLEITRTSYGPIYNAAVEDEPNGIGPSGTEWNSEYVYQYDEYQHLVLGRDGNTIDVITTKDYDNEYDGDIHVVIDEVNLKTYISNSGSDYQYVSYDSYYWRAQGNYNWITEDNLTVQKFLLYTGKKHRIITSTQVSEEFEVATEGFEIDNRYIFENGVVFILEDNIQTKFLFYNLLGELVDERTEVVSDWNMVANNGERSALLWWGEDNIRKVIFFNGQKITEFNSNYEFDWDWSLNDFEWLD